VFTTFVTSFESKVYDTRLSSIRYHLYRKHLHNCGVRHPRVEVTRLPLAVTAPG